MEIKDYKDKILKLKKEDVVRVMSKVTLDTVYFITGVDYGKEN